MPILSLEFDNRLVCPCSQDKLILCGKHDRKEITARKLVVTQVLDITNANRNTIGTHSGRPHKTTKVVNTQINS